MHDLTQLVAFIAWEAAFGWPVFLTASNAMVADLTSLEQRTEAFGVTRVALNAGGVVGPLLSGFVLVLDPSFRSSFLLGATICCALLVFIVFALKETRPGRAQATPDESARRRASLGGYGVVLRDRRFLLFGLVTPLPLYGFGQLWSIFPVALEKAQGTAPESWSRLLALYALSVTLLQYPIVRLVRRRDSILLMAAASTLVSVGLGAAVWLPFGWATRGLVLAISLGVTLLIPISQTVVSRLAPTELRGPLHGGLDAGMDGWLRSRADLRRNGDGPPRWTWCLRGHSGCGPVGRDAVRLDEGQLGRAGRRRAEGSGREWPRARRGERRRFSVDVAASVRPATGLPDEMRRLRPISIGGGGFRRNPVDLRCRQPDRARCR